MSEPMRKIVAYLAHPVSAPTPEGVEDNLRNARAWLKWLVCNTTWAISAPWMPYVETLDEDRYRERGLVDDLSMLERHDVIILTGGRISSGMRVERALAEEYSIPVCDLTILGVAPPTLDGVAARRMLAAAGDIVWMLRCGEIGELTADTQDGARRGGG